MSQIIEAIIDAEFDDLTEHMADEFALESLAFELEFTL